MAIVEMVMPKMGESIMEGTILNWLKKEGDKIEQDESVLEVATDKVDTEVPAVHAGILKQILVKEGEVVQVGKPIALISTNGDGEPDADTGQKTVAKEAAVAEITEKVVPEKTIKAQNGQAEVEKPAITKSAGSRFYSPLVLNIAKEENISIQELEKIPGTGKDQRVTKRDILGYLQNRGTQAGPYFDSQSEKEGQVSAAAPATYKINVSVNAGDEIIEMDRMRKMIAERMVASKHIAPHVTSFVEADVTNVVSWRNKVKNEFYNKEGDVLTFTPIFIEAVVKAIQDYPMINISVDGDKIIKRKDINIGMAVALPSGNLIVPVIKNADRLSIIGLTKKVNDLARRARDNKLNPDDLTGGTFTISNVGSFGNVMGTPIIVQPQVGILALGTITKKPAVIETPQGDFIGIRHKMFLSHSYDHRVIDGALGGMFVRRVADFLERFDVNRHL